ncbi:MAG: MFS transporter [Rhizobiales bacterium]|nr:MFS transporter [Hyphomicrobiales bacterium]
MTTSPERARDKPGLIETLSVYLQPRVLIVVVLGFSSGLPLALSGATLSVWMTERGVDLSTIGLFSLVGLPYTIKFLWAPLVDALDVPLLSRLFGRRRGWLLLSQFLLAAAVLFLAFRDPAASPWMVAFAALLVTTASATQDIVVDAFRVESLAVDEQAAGMAGYVAAYRVGMLATGAGVILLVAWLEWKGVPREDVWRWGYIAAAAMVGVGIVATLLAREPAADPTAAMHGDDNPVTRVMTTAYGAFQEFLSRDSAVMILLFVLLYKFCDAFAGVLTAPFVIAIGFDKAAYAGIVKGVGFAAALAGGFAGGFVARALPLVTALWIGAFLQMGSNLMFAWQAMVGVNHTALAVTIAVENFTGGVGTVIFVAYLSALCGNRAHTATQYALLTALAAVGRTVLAAGGGYVAESTGWVLFFTITALSALPSLVLLAWLQRRGHFLTLVPPRTLPRDD